MVDWNVILSPQMLRKKFNNSQLARSLETLDRKYLRNAVLKDPSSRSEPKGTRSQTIRYSKGGQWLLEVHQYLRPGNTIGGKGLPDPKRIRENGTIYTVPPKPWGSYNAKAKLLIILKAHVLLPIIWTCQALQRCIPFSHS